MPPRTKTKQKPVALKVMRTKWMAYTFLVGLIPMAMRSLAWATTREGKVVAFAAQDLLVFGLVLHVSIMNELEHIAEANQNWKSVQNGLALIFISLYSCLYAVNIIGERSPDLVDNSLMLEGAAILVAVSIIVCIKTMQRLLKLSEQ